jgi:hypothetical protein
MPGGESKGALPPREKDSEMVHDMMNTSLPLLPFDVYSARVQVCTVVESSPFVFLLNTSGFEIMKDAD